jgi:hypothetical protein
MRFALDNDALRRVVAVAIRRARRVRRGYKKEQRSCENSRHYFSQLAAKAHFPSRRRVVAVIKKTSSEAASTNKNQNQSTLQTGGGYNPMAPSSLTPLRSASLDWHLGNFPRCRHRGTFLDFMVLTYQHHTHVVFFQVLGDANRAIFKFD